MKKRFIIVLLTALILIFCGCERKNGDYFTDSERFIIVSGGVNLNAPYNTNVIVDKDTGVLYLCVYFCNQFGITPLLDADGKPLLLEEQSK